MKFNKASIIRRLNKYIVNFINKLEKEGHNVIDYEISDGPWYGEPIIYLKDNILKAIECINYNTGNELILLYKYKINKKIFIKEAYVKINLVDNEFSRNLLKLYNAVLTLYKEKQINNGIKGFPVDISIIKSPKLISTSGKSDIYEYPIDMVENISCIKTSFVLRTEDKDIPIDIQDVKAIIEFKKNND